MIRIALMAALLLVGPAGQARAQAPATPSPPVEYPANMPQAPMNEEVLRIPTDGADPVALQVTVFKPDGPGPFPLAVANHGATASGSRSHDEPRYRLTFSADYFLSRGYAVALPMLRGYAGSEGFPRYHGCDYATMALENAVDIRAVIQFMAHQPYVDATRIVVSGQSLGGLNTLAVGTLGVPGVKGLVNFNGGVVTSDCSRPESSLVDAVGPFGSRTAVPSIWFYGDNDRWFSGRTWRGMHDRYTSSGGQAELVDIGKFKKNSHDFLSYYEAIPIWAPKVDAFLARIGMPSTSVYPQFMPILPPPASGFARIDDVDAVPYLNGPAQDAYRKFLAQPVPRAFAVGLNGAAEESGGFDPPGVALNHCQRTGRCQLYAVDDHVVWTRQTPEPPPTRFAGLADASAVPYMNDNGRAGYAKFLALPRPRAFVIAPDGGWDASAKGWDPLAYALNQCGRLHQGCALYAVDSDVVWAGSPAGIGTH